MLKKTQSNNEMIPVELSHYVHYISHIQWLSSLRC